MPITDADFPIQFLVGRELASRENVDSSTAARSALTGSLLSGGLMGPLLARHLAARQAPTPPPPIIDTRPGGTGDSPWTDLLTSVKVILDQTSAQVNAAREEAQKAQELADQMQKDRTDALKEICDTLTTAPSAGKAPPTPGAKTKVD